MAKYGMPTALLEGAAERYRQGFRDFDYFKGMNLSSGAEQSVAAPNEGSTDTAESATDIKLDVGVVCESEFREQYVPTWKGLALATECNIIRLNALKKVATSIYKSDGNEVMR